MKIEQSNRHWLKSYDFKLPIKRRYFEQLKEQLSSSKLMMLLVGLRRVGKTTLMFQLIEYLITQNIERDAILYYSFDNQQELDDVINYYLKISNKDITKDTLYFFFDEIQKLPDWQNKIKLYYDMYPNIKIVLSGSSSLFLRSTESLAGRIVTTTIKPLFFDEYLTFRDMEYFLENPKLHYQNLLLEFEKYLYRQFYDTIHLNLMDAKRYVNDLKNKIIRQDAKAYFDVKYPDLLVRLFDIFAQKP